MVTTARPPAAPAGAGERPLLLRHAALVVAVVLAVLAGAAGYLALRPHTWTSSASVLVPPTVYAGGSPQAPDMGTEKEIATSGDVLAVAASRTGVPLGTLRGELNASSPADTNVLEISVGAASAAEAQRRAQAVAQAYVAYRTSPAPGSLRTTEPVRRLEIITAADLPAAPGGVSPALVVVVALVAGLALAVGAALLVDRLSDEVRGPDDLSRQTGLPVLTVVPPAGRRAAPVTQLGRPGAVPEAYRFLRARVLRGVPAGQRTSVLLTSGAAGAASWVAAANLAVSVAETGRRAALVCADPAADLEVPEVGQALAAGEAERGAGGRTQLLPTTTAGLVLVRGSEDASGLRSPARTRELVTRAMQEAEVVVVAAPPVLDVADALTLAELVDKVVLVADARRSTRREVREAVAVLDAVGERVIGAVQVAVPRSWRRARWSRPPQLPAAEDESGLRPPAAATG